ncbi:MAG: S-layer homology domain-containing protein, partial [Vallitaleaceae bacterium]|nr:S-layer homology domain-containing protein [Vallitaleaceae bacterium]
EEFAELAVKVYEVYEGIEATPISPNPFKDASNLSVLKANQLGIVNGTSATTFAPKNLTTREEIAAMLNRTIKAIEPDTDFSTVGAPTFLDSAKVKTWFAENVKFMSLHEFIKGSNNNFDPEGKCTREAAILIAVRVYKAYKK